MNNIFVYIELENGAVADVSLELLTKGRELADELGVKLEAVVLGHGVAGIEKELAKYGADTVWVADDEIFAPFRTLPHFGRARPRRDDRSAVDRRIDDIKIVNIL